MAKKKSADLVPNERAHTTSTPTKEQCPFDTGLVLDL